MKAQRVDDFRVAEFQHVLPLLDHGDAGPEGGEHRGVLDADHAGPDDHHGRRQRLQLQDLVGVQDPVVVEVHATGPSRGGSGGDDDVAPADGDPLGVAGVVDQDGVFVDKPGMAGEQFDAVAHQLAAHHLDLFADDVLGAGQQVSRGDLLLHPVTRAVHLALVEPGQVHHGLAQRLGWNGAGVDADAAQHVAAFDHRDGLSQLGCSDRSFLATRARTDDDEVVLHTHEEQRYAGSADLAGCQVNTE